MKKLACCILIVVCLIVNFLPFHVYGIQKIRDKVDVQFEDWSEQEFLGRRRMPMV